MYSPFFLLQGVHKKNFSLESLIKNFEGEATVIDIEDSTCTLIQWKKNTLIDKVRVTSAPIIEDMLRKFKREFRPILYFTILRHERIHNYGCLYNGT